MNKVIIKDKEKLLNYIQMPEINSKKTNYCAIYYDCTCCCPHYDSNLNYNDTCNLFDEELEYSNKEGYYLRCQKCLDSFEVENEN